MKHHCELFEVDYNDDYPYILLSIKLKEWIDANCKGDWQIKTDLLPWALSKDEIQYFNDEEFELCKLVEAESIIFYQKGDATLYKLTWL